MYHYGTLIRCEYERPYYGLIVSQKDLTEQEKFDLKPQMLELSLTFLVRFVEAKEATIDCVGIEKLTIVTQQEIAQVANEPQFAYYRNLIATNQLHLVGNQYMHASAKNQENSEIGNWLLPELITATIYPVAQRYLSQLLKSTSNPFAIEQLNALNCLQYEGVVLGRYPAIPNYKAAKFFGNSLERDYAGVQLGQRVFKLFDTCLIDSQLVRIERIVKILSDQNKQLIICGVTTDGITMVGTPAQIEQAPTHNEPFSISEPYAVPQLLEPLDLCRLQSTEYMEQQDADLRLGSNFASVDGLNLTRKDRSCSPATILDLKTARYQFVQGRVLEVGTGKDVSFKFFKLDQQCQYLVDLNVEMADQILSTVQIEEALQYCQANVPLDLTGQNFISQQQKLQVERKYQCCFCGKPADTTSIGFIYALPLLKRPVFQAVVNTAVIASVHKRCAEYCPEVSLEDITLKGDNSLVFEVPETYPSIVKLLIYDRYLRKQTLQAQKLNYDAFREALKPDRIELKCKICIKQGAVIGCCNKSCYYTVHYDCAVDSGLKFEGKQFFCRAHAKK